MKNIHILQTDKPSRLFIDIDNDKLTITNNPIGSEHFMNQNIYITSSEEIKEGDWVLSKLNEVILFGINYNKNLYKKIILTTDQDLINDGVQAIGDEFLEWFVKNLSCEEIEIDKNWNYPLDKSWKYKIIIPKEEQKQHLIEMIKADEELGLYEEPKQETLEHTSKFIVFTLQDSEDWVQYSIALDSFEKADNFCQQFRDKKMSYLICQTLKQGYNGK